MVSLDNVQVNAYVNEVTNIHEFRVEIPIAPLAIYRHACRPQLLGEPLGVLAVGTPLAELLERSLDEFQEDLDRHLAESSNDLKRLIPGGF
jgi:hypothetical protein